ncbi:M23 family metallopeptidase [Isoptericola sp. NPDC019482]|uniref:M23 family metallopeptidase n=1 Tax=Isoptericola sp. NPDC019482 TaxID=3154688 RepID=UPI00348BBA12
MRRPLLLAVLPLALLPGAVVATVALALLPGVEEWCEPTVGTLGPTPDRLEARTRDGVLVHLDRTQLGHAATIVAVGARVRGVGRDGLVIALMAALTESRLRQYANTTAYPSSADYPHDADGSDHDSLGLFQMRPAAGWGTVAQLMDPAYQARAFFGGAAGPNHGSPRGLLDIPDWRHLAKGTAAQAVEVSAFPDRYAAYEPVAEAILDALTSSADTTGDRPAAPNVAGADRLPATTSTTFPLPTGAWTATSGFGMRRNPVLGVRRLHAGVDIAASAGTPILATAAGRVVHAGPRGGLGNAVAVAHDVDGRVVVSVYGHIRDDGIHVRSGDLLAAGDWIADVGSTGNSTGPHLHFELRPGGLDEPAVDPQAWLDATDTRDLDDALDTLPARSPALCTDEEASA